MVSVSNYTPQDCFDFTKTAVKLRRSFLERYDVLEALFLTGDAISIILNVLVLVLGIKLKAKKQHTILEIGIILINTFGVVTSTAVRIQFFILKTTDTKVKMEINKCNVIYPKVLLTWISNLLMGYAMLLVAIERLTWFGRCNVHEKVFSVKGTAIIFSLLTVVCILTTATIVIWNTYQGVLEHPILCTDDTCVLIPDSLNVLQWWLVSVYYVTAMLFVIFYLTFCVRKMRATSQLQRLQTKHDEVYTRSMAVTISFIFAFSVLPKVLAHHLNFERHHVALMMLAGLQLISQIAVPVITVVFYPKIREQLLNALPKKVANKILHTTTTIVYIGD